MNSIPSELKKPSCEHIVAEGLMTTAILFEALFLTCFHWRNVALTFFTFIISMQLIVAFVPAAWGMAPRLILGICVAPIFLLFFWRQYFLDSFWRTQDKQLRDGPQRQQIVLSESGIDVAFHGTTSRYAWSQVSRHLITTRMIVIALKQGDYVIIPAQFLASRSDFGLLAQKIIARIDFASVSQFGEHPATGVGSSVTGNGETIVGQGEMTWGEVRIAYWYFRWRSISLTIIAIFLLTTAILVTTFFAIAFRSWIPIPVIACWLMIAVTLAQFAWWRFRPTRQWYRDSFAGVTTQWTINEHQLTCESPKNRMQFEWGEITRFVEQRDGLILIRKQIQAIYLPRRCFESDEDWRQVIAWARQSQKRN